MSRKMFKRLWASSGLDLQSFLFIMKVSAPPVIAQSLYQSEAAARLYGDLGYLLALSTLLASGTLPRAKFVHNMFISLLCLSVAGAVNMLALYTGLKARSGSFSGAPTYYSSSQQAVCAGWLFLQIYVASYYKSAYPQYNYAILSYEIVAVVAMIAGSQYTTLVETTAFIRTILITFLTGFAITSAVSLILKPLSCRKIAFDDMTSYLGAIRNALTAQMNYMTSVEQSEIFPRTKSVSRPLLESQPRDDFVVEKSALENSSLEAEKLRLATNGLLAAHGKLSGNMMYAKREISWGTLGPDDISDIAKLLSEVMQPLVGLSSIIDILDTVAKLHGWDEDAGPVSESDLELVRQQTVVVKEWQTIMRMLHTPFHDIIEVMFRANEQVMLSLSLKRSPKTWSGKDRKNSATSDEEAAKQFQENDIASELEMAIQTFFIGRKIMIHEWCIEQGVDLSMPASISMPSAGPTLDEDMYKQKENHIQLLVLLYMRQLLRTTSQNLLKLVRYVDQKAASGVLSRRQLILPGSKRIRKMIHPGYNKSNTEHFPLDERENRKLLLDDTLYARKDPEHLPAVNMIQRMGNSLRVIPCTLRSGHSVFGFRVACAVMSLAVLGFLSDTKSFFIAQRGTWALIMIVFSMIPTAGASTFQFFYRCVGTFLALIWSFACYYIANGNSSGILIILYISMFFFHWIMVKKPKYVTMGVIGAMAVVVIIGYVFEEKALGEDIQPFYPPYLIGPYRFLCVIIGVCVAFIWTVFPYPITERSEVRRGTATLLHLLAKYYVMSHATSLARIQGLEINTSTKRSPGWILEKARNKTLAKAQLMIDRLKVNSAMIKWQLSVGGAFPKETYAAILSAAERFLRSTTLLADAALAFSEPGDPAQAEWLQELRALVVSVQETSHEVSSVLSVLSSSVASGEPLPPFLRMPEPFRLIERLKTADPTVMATAHLAEPGYAAVAVIQLASGAVETELEVLVREVKNLVGELDFRFRSVALSAAGSIIDNRNQPQTYEMTTETTLRYRGTAGEASTRGP